MPDAAHRPEPVGEPVRAPSPRVRQLLDAAVVVTAHGGLRGLTHRAVDRQCGLAEGTCSAYLRTRDALVTALMGHINGLLLEQVERLASELRPHGDAGELEHAVTALIEDWLAHPDLLLARAELALEAVRRPDLGKVFRPWRERLVELVAGIVERYGRPDPVVRARTIVAGVEGVVVAAFGSDSPTRDEQVRASVRMIFRALAAYDGETVR